MTDPDDRESAEIVGPGHVRSADGSPLRWRAVRTALATGPNESWATRRRDDRERTGPVQRLAVDSLRRDRYKSLMYPDRRRAVLAADGAIPDQRRAKQLLGVALMLAADEDFVDDALRRARNELNDLVTAAALGPDWRHKVRSDEGGDRFESLDDAPDGDRPLHDRLADRSASSPDRALEAQEELDDKIDRIVRMLDAGSTQQREIVLAYEVNPFVAERFPDAVDLSPEERDFVEADCETYSDVADAVGIESLGQVRTQHKRCKDKLNG